MSTHVVGFRPPDADYKAKADAWRACKAAGVNPPRELCDMFDGDEPQDAGQQCPIAEAVRPYSSEGCEGFDVEIAKLPKGVKVVRFYNSW